MTRARFAVVGALAIAVLAVGTFVAKVRPSAEDVAARDRLAKALAAEDLEAVRAGASPTRAARPAKRPACPRSTTRSS